MIRIIPQSGRSSKDPPDEDSACSKAGLPGPVEGASASAVPQTLCTRSSQEAYAWSLVRSYAVAQSPTNSELDRL
jgi:hypothetical protein